MEKIILQNESNLHVTLNLTLTIEQTFSWTLPWSESERA